MTSTQKMLPQLILIAHAQQARYFLLEQIRQQIVLAQHTSPTYSPQSQAYRKVFSYTGNGSSQTINCGFTGGARFVLIKRTDSTGNWTVFDSARGIVAGNDPALYLNSTAAEVTTIDAVDTDSSGFIVNQDTTLNLNVNNATYIGLAIA